MGFEFVVEHIRLWIFATVNNIFIVEILIWTRRGPMVFILHVEGVFHKKNCRYSCVLDCDLIVYCSYTQDSTPNIFIQGRKILDN